MFKQRGETLQEILLKMREFLSKEQCKKLDVLIGSCGCGEQKPALHPSLYLTAMEEYEKAHDYGAVEELGKRALEKLGAGLVVRSRVALKAAHASSFLGHTDEMMRFCLEGFRSDSTDRNFLRLFGTKEMAEQYSPGTPPSRRRRGGFSAYSK